MFKKGDQSQSNYQTQQIPIRIIPGIIIVAMQWLIRFVVPVIVPGSTVMAIGVFGGLLGGLALIVWWVFFSRAPRFDRWIALVLMAGGLIVTSTLLDKSIATGMQGMMFPVFSVPLVSLAFMLWVIASRGLSLFAQRLTMVATIVISCGAWILLRSDGISGNAGADFAWRWARTAEEKLLAEQGNPGMMPERSDNEAVTEALWPGFRGLQRDGVVRGLRIETDWKKSPPKEIWRQAIGPGCSSFAVGKDLFYTQEQRGDNEQVTCYKLATGELLWTHSDKARFWDSHAGAGPRGTPALSNGFVITLGATGILNVLDALNGKLAWSRNAADDTGWEHSGWGYSSSPIVINDLVVVAVGGGLASYDVLSGDPRWTSPEGGRGYSSPHVLTIDGMEQILLMSQIGAISVSPEDGSLLWKHEWTGECIVQPAIAEDGDLVLALGGAKGMCRIHASLKPEGWKTEERWTSNRLRPNFNDYVVHKDHVYGFDGLKLGCLDISDGKRKWRGNNYGGQIILLADQDLLLVLTEKGGLALAEASPSRFRELASIPAIEGKTWNHPVLIGNTLLIRNTQEMVAYELELLED